MVIVVHVGEPDDLPPIPETFPTCGNYPHLKSDEGEGRNNFLVPFDMQIFVFCDHLSISRGLQRKWLQISYKLRKHFKLHIT